MVKAVFVTKIGSSYDDIPEEQYHFPRSYLERVKQTIGDKIIYYEPRRGGGKLSYFATARVTGIEEDRRREDHFYAKIDNFISFDRPVHFQENGGFESKVVREDGSVNRGAAGHAVRLIPDHEFEAILGAGFFKKPLWPDRNETTGYDSLEEESAEFERPIVEQILRRKYRDAKFRQHVQAAYDRRCAFTGLRLLNGRGRPEVEAAHIKPVSENGPDSVRNGIALSGTVHWMFDRGLLSLSDDYSILTSRKLNHDVSHLLNPDMRAIVPDDTRLQPHPIYLRWHREYHGFQK